MDITTIIGLVMVIAFLISVCIAIWKDTEKEKRFWDDWNKK